MNQLDFTFEPAPWEVWLHKFQAGDRINAAELLALLEGETEQCVEDALNALELGCMDLDVSELPRYTGTGEAAQRLHQEAQMALHPLCFADLEETDPLRLFLEEVASMAAWGDEAALALRCAAGESGLCQQLTNLGLARVIDLAREYTGYGVLLMDLIQEGSLGLWQAVQCWHGGDYPAHRDRWIRLYLARAVTVQARANGVGQKLRTALEDYRGVDERLLGELGRNPSLEEMADALHMNVEETERVRAMLESARLLARTRREPEPEEEEIAQEQAVEDTALFQMRRRILDLLSALPEEDAKLLTLRFGLEGGLPLSPEDTGRKLGLTVAQVVEKEAAALALLRTRKE